MKKQDGSLTYSPSDLIRFLDSPFASFMQRLHVEVPGRAQPDEEDAQLKLLAAKGIEHERAYVDALVAEGRDVCVIESGPDAAAATRAAIEAGREIIFQAALDLAPFRGFADFLVRTDTTGPGGQHFYEVHDTKLASKPKPYYLVQLCAYAEMLAAIQGVRPERVAVILGTGERRWFRTDDFFFYYLDVKRAFLEQMNAFSLDAPPPIPDAHADHGRWQSHAESYLDEVDHLVRVAGISRGQILKLNAAGIETLADLAVTEITHVPKIDDGILSRLKQQARLQRSADPEAPPPYELIPPDANDPRRGLAILPPASSGDIFFDLEGYPLAHDGLEYLLGAVHLVDDEPQFQDFWAFDPESEKAAFENTIDWIMDRLRRDPQMHIYHYAPYETQALKKLMGKYGTREDEVDHLLRRGVFVDLFRVVRESLRIGEPSYSLKKVERLYMSREGEVESAGESIVQFAAWLQSDEPRDWKASPILKDIRDYNEDDCLSTWKLAKWLWARQAESGPEWIPADKGAPPTEFPPLKDAPQARRDLADSLLAPLPVDPGEDDDDQRIQRMLAHLIEFHRREEKPVWWSFFERHEWLPEQHVDDLTCIGNVERVGDPRPEKRSFCCSYRFNPDQDTKLGEGHTVYFAGDREAAFTVHTLDAEAGTIELKASANTLAKSASGEFPQVGGLLEHGLVGAGAIAESILRTAQDWADSQLLPTPLRNLLLRRPPPLKPKRAGPLLGVGEDIVKGTARVIEALDGATLCIQGPPGAGKTFTASRVIAKLLAAGRNVGVVSNSHKAVINVLESTHEVMGDEFRCIKCGGDSDEPFLSKPGVTFVKDGGKASAAYSDGLIGGTAWLFSREDMRDCLDYLFVDEAGQVALANLVGMAPSTRNIVLLGDQMQLGQPTQGTHPGESGASALEYALNGHATVPPELGIFLGTTWRLHPDICSFISGAVYEDRLQPEGDTARRVIRLPTTGTGLVPIEAGMLFSPVEHEGNTQASDEEVERIVAIVNDLLGREKTDGEGQVVGAVSLDDILFVAPFNMQVRRLRQQLPSGARVASVDKFQGQEAPIVIVSLCASYGEQGPRGLAFVLDKNRLNVAISRAQSLAIIVGDPRIATTPVNSLADMERVNLFCRLRSLGDHSTGDRDAQ